MRCDKCLALSYWCGDEFCKVFGDFDDIPEKFYLEDGDGICGCKLRFLK